MSESLVLVGYALNSKKLRRSDSGSSGSSSGAGGAAAADPPPSLQSSSPQAAAIFPFTRVWCGGGLADILDGGFNWGVSGVKFQLWDPLIPLAQQPKFDLIVHKLTEDLSPDLEQLIDKDSGSSAATTSTSMCPGCSSSNKHLSPSSGGKIAALEQYLDANPHTKIVDPISAVRHVVSRERTCRALERIPGDIVRQPKFFIHGATTKTSTVHFVSSMREHGVEFPVICKPISACGTPASHHMVVVVDSSGLQQLSAGVGYVVQQFHNHDNSFYKVYVIDSDVMVFRRPSLPNLLPENLRSVEFDSRLPYPTIDDFLRPAEGSGFAQQQQQQQKQQPQPQPPPLPPLASCPSRQLQLPSKSGSSFQLSVDSANYQRFRDVAFAIKAEFGLSLFGFDVINPTDNPDELLVVDVNYFPSYKEVSDFPQRFIAYLRLAAQ